jgi:hypothetical protein
MNPLLFAMLSSSSITHSLLEKNNKIIIIIQNLVLRYIIDMAYAFGNEENLVTRLQKNLHYGLIVAELLFYSSEFVIENMHMSFACFGF